MASWPGILLAAATLSFIGLFFQVAGYVLPWWFVLGDGQYIGIWYFVLCKDGINNVRNCSVFSFNEASSITEYSGSSLVTQSYFTGIQVCATVAVGLVLFVTLGFICGGCGLCRAKVGYVWGCIFLFISGLVLLPSLGLFAWMHVHTLTSLTGYNLVARSFPWSVVAAGLGSLFTLLAAIVLAIALCRWEYHMYGEDDDDYDDRGHQHVPMSHIDHKRSYDRTGYDNQAYPSYGGSYGHDKQQYHYASPQRYGQSSNQQHNQYAQPQNTSPYRQTSNMYRPIAASTKRDRY